MAKAFVWSSRLSLNEVDVHCWWFSTGMKQQYGASMINLAALRETPRVDSLSRARNTRLLSQCRIWMKLTDLLCLCQTSNALEHVICCPWKLHWGGHGLSPKCSHSKSITNCMEPTYLVQWIGKPILILLCVQQTGTSASTVLATIVTLVIYPWGLVNYILSSR